MFELSLVPIVLIALLLNFLFRKKENIKMLHKFLYCILGTLISVILMYLIMNIDDSTLVIQVDEFIIAYIFSLFFTFLWSLPSKKEYIVLSILIKLTFAVVLFIGAFLAIFMIAF